MEDYKADAGGSEAGYSVYSPRLRARKAKMARAKSATKKNARPLVASSGVVLSESHFAHFEECMTQPTRATEEMAEVARQIREFKKPR